MKKRLVQIGTTAILALALTPVSAFADVIFSPFLGVTFGGDTHKNALVYGGSLTFMGGGIFGFELDAALAPDMLDRDDDIDLRLGSNSVGTVMANLILGAPIGEPGIRPYVSGGVGLLRLNIEDPLNLFDTDRNSLGANLGVGVMGFFSEHVGAKADVRYFRRMRDDDPGTGIDLDLGQYNFWRAAAGLSVRF